MTGDTFTQKSWRTGAAVRAGAMGFVALVGAAGLTWGATAPADAAAGSPGQVQTGAVTFTEGFQDATQLETIPRVNSYVNAQGVTYGADAGWLTGCNGILVAGNSPTEPGAATVNECSPLGEVVNWNSLQQAAVALGMAQGMADAASNVAVIEQTHNNPGTTRMLSADLVSPLATGRYLALSVDAVPLNCEPEMTSRATLKFRVADAAGELTDIGNTVDVNCATAVEFDVPAIGAAEAETVLVGTYTAASTTPVMTAPAGWQIDNLNTTGVGNDIVFDGVRVRDVSPQLDKSFSPSTLLTGEKSMLTLTVTNSSDRGAKNGWAFSDALPQGLRVADGSASTTCTGAALEAPAGATTVSMTGNLDAGVDSCTVTVAVTSAQAGTYVNGPSNVTTLGLHAPADARVTFQPRVPGLAMTKSTVEQPGDILVAGDVLNYEFAVKNTGTAPLANLAIEETAFTGTGEAPDAACPVVALAPGAETVCAASYTVTAADVQAFGVTNTARAVATVVGDADTQVSSADSTAEYFIPVVFDGAVTTDAGTVATIVPTLGDGMVASSVVLVDPATKEFATQPVVVEGEGTWAVDAQSSAVTFTPVAGFVTSPTPIAFSAEGEDGSFAEPAVLRVTYVDVPVALVPQAAPPVPEAQAGQLALTGGSLASVITGGAVGASLVGFGVLALVRRTRKAQQA